ncbi:zeta toxin family protein [Antrihabitans cavernicola]|uniref:AAA family ATPase n=1 Tax=Antrihabitans cavernicola TaxID=2495913 RepID=A0A5A7SF47_9NOCA|nr:AAA family ATPase [Spelaeibacter cavernicola]KAA0023317.1 AAA family ATPase [Spelaeibacter cavernicola]
MSPRLDLVVGCNGAGKSTLVDTVLAPLLIDSVFVNADQIAKARWPDDPVAHSYDAAKVAARTRSTLLTLGRSFIAETVFSHPSKLELITEAHERGFRVVLHVVMVPEDYAVERVRLRVASGGHDVPEAKIRQRYSRVWPLVATAITRCDQATVYDNHGRTTRIVARYVDGTLVADPQWPNWTPTALTNPPHRA